MIAWCPNAVVCGNRSEGYCAPSCEQAHRADIAWLDEPQWRYVDGEKVNDFCRHANPCGNCQSCDPVEMAVEVVFVPVVARCRDCGRSMTSDVFVRCSECEIKRLDGEEACS